MVQGLLGIIMPRRSVRRKKGSLNLFSSLLYKEFNNCYILLSNISQSLENTKFIAGKLSLRLSLMLYLDGTMQMWVDAEDSLKI